MTSTPRDGSSYFPSFLEPRRPAEQAIVSVVMEVRLAGALLIEQNDEWLVCRRYLSEESLALVLEDQGEEEQEVVELQAA